MALLVIIFLGGLYYILSDKDSNTWQKIVKFIMLLVLMAVLYTCASIGGNSWYDSHMKIGDI